MTALKVDDNWLIVSDEPAKDGEMGLFKDWDTRGTFICILSDGESKHFKGTIQNVPKIIATSKKIGELPMVDVPDWENDDTRWNAEKYVLSQFIDYGDLNEQATGQIYDAYLDGYNKAKEKYQFTLEDMKEALRVGCNIGMSGFEPIKNAVFGEVPFWNTEKMVRECKDYLESLTKPKQYQVEIEMEETNLVLTFGGQSADNTTSYYQPKITEGKVKILNWKELWKN